LPTVFNVLTTTACGKVRWMSSATLNTSATAGRGSRP
jgi:hypothetical protein